MRTRLLHLKCDTNNITTPTTFVDVSTYIVFYCIVFQSIYILIERFCWLHAYVCAYYVYVCMVLIVFYIDYRLPDRNCSLEWEITVFIQQFTSVLLTYICNSHCDNLHSYYIKIELWPCFCFYLGAEVADIALLIVALNDGVSKLHTKHTHLRINHLHCICGEIFLNIYMNTCIYVYYRCANKLLSVLEPLKD